MGRVGSRLSEIKIKKETHHEKTENGEDGHEHASFLSNGERVEKDEGLRGVERKEDIQVGGTEEEDDGCHETQHACRHGTVEDPFPCNNPKDINNRFRAEEDHNHT